MYYITKESLGCYAIQKMLKWMALAHWKSNMIIEVIHTLENSNVRYYRAWETCSFMK